MRRRKTSRATVNVAVAFFVGLVGVLSAAAPALAEVCDKAAGDHWMPEDGPMLVLGYGRAFTVCVVVGCLLAAYVVRRAAALPLMVIGAGLFAIGVAALTDGVFAPDIYMAAVREGCRALRADIVGLTIGVALIVLGGWLRRAGPPRGGVSATSL
jgi:hypothetical protein